MRKAPQKDCPKCNAKLHVKNSKCSCGHIFYTKKNGDIQSIGQEKRTENNIEPGLEKRGSSWNELKFGDIIKSVAGHGPFYVSKDNGEKLYMGSYGKFKVVEVLHNGIRVHNKYGGSEFLYMGPVCKSTNLDSYFSAPHKILKLVGRRAELNA